MRLWDRVRRTFVVLVQPVVSHAPARARALLPPRMPARPLTLSEYAFDLLERRERVGFKSAADHRSVLVHHIAPDEIGQMPIRDIRTKHVRAFVERMQVKEKTNGETLAGCTVRNIYAQLRAIMSRAEADEVIDKNPCRLKHELPKNAPRRPDFKETSVFDLDEVRRIIHANELPLRRRALYATLFMSGARIGELSGLVWSRVRFDAKPLGKITIVEAFSSKRKVIDTTKTGALREAPIHPTLLPILVGWRDAYEKTVGREPSPSALVFPAVRGGGTRCVRNTVVLRRLHRDLDLLGLRRRHTHCTRRTFITIGRNTPGANALILERITHARPGSVVAGYHETPYADVCRELAKLEF
jgi:integrase